MFSTDGMLQFQIRGLLIAETVNENYALVAMTRLIALLRRKYEQGRRSGLVLCTHSNYFCSFIQRNTISVSVKINPKNYV